MALAISQSEAEAKEHERQRMLYNLYNGPDDDQSTVSSHPEVRYLWRGTLKRILVQPPTQNERVNDNTAASVVSSTEPMDPELARYLDRDFWQNKHNVRSLRFALFTLFIPSCRHNRQRHHRR